MSTDNSLIKNDDFFIVQIKNIQCMTYSSKELFSLHWTHGI